MDVRDPSSNADTQLGGRRHGAASLLVVGAAVLVLLAGVAWRAQQSDPSTTAAAGECGDGLGGPAALVGFDARTGALRWSRRVGERSGATDMHGVIATIDRDGDALGINSTNGEVKWCRALGGAATSDSAPSPLPAFVTGADSIVTLTGGGHVIALNPADGTTRWETPTQFSSASSLIGGPIIYVMGIPTAPTIMAPPPPVDSSDSGNAPTSAPPVSMLAAFPPAVIAVLDASNGRVLADAPLPASTKSSAAGELIVVDPVYSPSRQEIPIGVRDLATGTDHWSKVVPGFTASITDVAVLVIDQTGGTGDATSLATGPGQVQTVLTAYSAATGDLLWHVNLPGTPQQPFPVGDSIVIANGPQVFSINATTGTVEWSVDHGSPGVTDRYSEPGGYWWFGHSGDGSVIVGLITASEPYRD